MRTADFQTLLDLKVRRDAVETVTDDIIATLDSMTAAICKCIETSRMQPKTIAYDLEIDPGQFSRIMSGQAHFPQDKLPALMDLCGNEIPLRWLALARGKGLVVLKSALEEENEQLRAALAEQHQKMEAITEFMRKVKA